MEDKEATQNRRREIALLGNPNSGKTTIFNALTGLRHKIANYPGVTVEKRLGTMMLPASRRQVTVLDLPGAYSLLPHSPEEEVVHNVLLGVQKGTPAPDLAVLVLDAGNLERNLYLALQVIEAGLPTVLVLNMWDLAESKGSSIDIKKLETLTGVRCVKTIGGEKGLVSELKRVIEEELEGKKAGEWRFRLPLPPEIEAELTGTVEILTGTINVRPEAARGEALRLLQDAEFSHPLLQPGGSGESLKKAVLAARSNLEAKGIDWAAAEATSRYAQIEWIFREAARTKSDGKVYVSERLDQILMHPVWGLPIFAGLMAFVFQSIFSWAGVPMNWLSLFIDWLGHTVSRFLPDGQLESLVVDGMIAGVGNILIFLPQIFLLFFFIAIFEDVGYMARAAFVLDRFMKKVGLNGKAFLPLLSCFACAVPGIMATRTIEDRNDRLTTILVAPLMSCSARLPVYTLMIGAFVPSVPVLGFFDLKGVTLFSMYALGILVAVTVAAIFRRTLLKGSKTPFVFELPPYRLPNWKTVFSAMWDHGKEFIYRAGSIIFCISIVLWFLVSYPKSPSVEARFDQDRETAIRHLSEPYLAGRLDEIHRAQASEQIKASFAGRIGRAIEPVIKPLGFDWRIGIGLVASFAAREVLVSTLAIVHHVEVKDAGGFSDLVHALQTDRSPATGRPAYGALTALSLMVFFVLACQCMSTIAVVKRETNGWRWPIFMITYMTALAWLGSFAVYQGGKLLGFG